MTFKMSEEAQTLKVCNLRADTQEFIGAGDAYIPPYTGLPANCTDIVPPDIPAGHVHVAVFDQGKATWSLMEDHRGKIIFDTKTGMQIFVTRLGPLPENTTSLAPDGQYQKWNGKAWVKDEEAEKTAQLRDAKNQKSRLMQAAERIIAPLARAEKHGLATEEELNRLIAWEHYSIRLSRAEISEEGDIELPEVPEIS